MDKKNKTYNKWKSRRWLIAIYLMLLLGIVLVGNKFIVLPENVLIALIGFTSAYLMVFTGYETKRKMNREEQENANK